MAKQKVFVYSPSNMDSYRQCPRRFQGSSITKEIPWKASTQKSRGTLVHNTMQLAVTDGLDAIKIWDAELDLEYTKGRVMYVRELQEGGAIVRPEHELVINRSFHPTDWWGDDAYLRAKADLLILPGTHPNFQDHALIPDYKTGKMWDKDAFQLRVEALLVHLLFKVSIVEYAYWYLDIGQPVGGVVDFRNGLGQVQDIIQLMKDIEQSLKQNWFPATPNKFCRFCAFHKTPKCGVTG